MKCKNCGGEISEGNLFCMNCGTPVTYEKNNKKTGIIVAVAVVAVVVIAAVAVIVGFSLNKDKTDYNESTPVSQREEVLQSEVASSAEQTTFNLVGDIETTTAPITETTTVQTVVTTTEKKTVPNFSYDDEKDQFLFDSANTYITKEYLSTCTRDEITVILNEIYARHGYIFKDAELREYFNSQSWYNGTETSMEKAAEYFNSIERKNIDTIYAYQKSMGWRS